MIECNAVSVGYAKKEILSCVSFTAESGKITVLLGKNGCGKTTLLKSISGNLKYKGNIKIDGAEVSSLTVRQKSRQIAVMAQMMKSPEVTVRELVSFGRQPYTGLTGILSSTDKRIVESVIEKTGLSGLAEQSVRRISGGERQKAYFALLLSQGTKTLLLDEPSSHLDADYTGRLANFLVSEKEEGKTILAVLHDVNRALDIADKIVVIDSGKVEFEGTSEQFCKGDIAERIFHLHKYFCEEENNPSNKKVRYL